MSVTNSYDIISIIMDIFTDGVSMPELRSRNGRVDKA